MVENARAAGAARPTPLVRDLPEVRVHSLCDRYPDFSIAPLAEQELLSGARR